MKKSIDDLIHYCEEHKYNFLYGAGKYGRIVRVFLDENGIGISGFVVTDSTMSGGVVLEKSVISFDEYLNLGIDSVGIIVATSEKNQKDITCQLNENRILDYYCVSDDEVEAMVHSCTYKRRYCSRNNITVFCYHRVADIPLDTWKLAVKPDLFEKQIRYIKENYVVLRSEEDWSFADNKPAAIITFDDGYEDVFLNALPILEKCDCPATVFVSTGNIDTNNEFWWDELEKVIFFSSKDKKKLVAFGEELKLDTDTNKEKSCYYIHPFIKRMNYKERKEFLGNLSKELGSEVDRDYCRSMSCTQIKQLSQSYKITIGGHTVTHSCLANESYEEQEYEIIESKKTIEDIIGKDITVFSYPFGQQNDYTKDTISIAQSAGYEKIFAAFSGITNSKYDNGNIPRINIGQCQYYDESIKQIRFYETIMGD